ncbi:hypothetical protein DL96DRAFT_1599747 [Flagelloscypha sp. PMI_526]|nr:hypothetical protein DL96DRAFT_1599747 [Flagelloscypha sp. PMI_526]
MASSQASVAPATSESVAASLLSLSMAAERAVPIAVVAQEDAPVHPSSSSPRQHRRLSSTSRSYRGVGADSRHSPSSISGMAGLSPSTSPSGLSSSGSERKVKHSVPIPISNVKPGKKRGQDYKCETCSKIYRHPSCLIKHRWEHTTQWREASKFVLSKHQQVQLLEAAAILSHLSPDSATGTSLPEDRSLWPSYLSNGTLPPPEGTTLPIVVPTKKASPISASVPQNALGISGIPNNGKRAGSTGPRLHDYNISASEGGITQVRPGLIGVPTGVSTGTSPVPVPQQTYGTSESWGAASSYQSGGGWSLPRSSVRSDSSEDDSDSIVDIEVDEPADTALYVGRSAKRVWKREDEDHYIGGGLREEDEYEMDAEDDIATKHRAFHQHSEEEWDGEMEMDMD